MRGNFGGLGRSLLGLRPCSSTLDFHRGMGAEMRMHNTEWLGSLGLALVISIGASSPPSGAQTMPSAGVNTLDQAVPDSPSSSLFPTSGLTLDGPVGLESSREADNSQPLPSDGLSLQIYDSRSSAPATGNDGDHSAHHNP